VAEESEVHQAIGHLFRHEAGRMTAVLARFLGAENLDVAEDLVQDTLLKAMETWRFRGMPTNPSAWLYKVAHNNAIDWVRTRQRKTKLLSANEGYVKEYWQLSNLDGELFTEEEIKDSVLRMIFACCHPSVPLESQIAVTLKIAGGLSTGEIASAFLTSEDTIAKRIYRAKEKIRLEKIKLDPPELFELPSRLDNVLQVLYLLFSEGYHATHSDAIIREDLCEEAMRLTYLLVQHHSTNLPKVNALLSLMCLQASRFAARTDDVGEIILLEYQDRSQWSKPLISKGLEFLEKASVGDALSEYHVEASIASIHALASSFEDTNWNHLVTLYSVLQQLKPGPIVSLNRAIAVGYAESPSEGIKELQKISELEDNCFYMTALGNFYLLQGKSSIAKSCFEKALSRNPPPREAELIRRNIGKCN
jgi:RNA polymerase sigma factor (sigma-70 family)